MSDVLVVSQLFGIKPVKAGSMLVKHLSPKNIPIELLQVDSKQLVGIEVEVENYAPKNGELSRVWSSKEDGSLRNAGIEWVTSPLPANQAPFALYNLLGDYLSADCCFSPRTSIHVHLNMQSMTEEQVKNLVLWYVLFEPLFYRYTGRGRQKNIYCVPIMDTPFLRYFNNYSLTDLLQVWSKYSGLNIIPLSNYGTIEFRHMHGTFDYTKISRWIRMICKLCEFVQEHNTAFHHEILSNCHERTDYQGLLFGIFGEDAMALKYKSVQDVKTTMHLVKQAFTIPGPTLHYANDAARIAPFFSVN